MICACKNWNGDCRYNSSRVHTQSRSARTARATDMEIGLKERGMGVGNEVVL